MTKKPLYISKSLVELHKLSEIKPELYNVKVSCQLLDKLFEKFETSYFEQDEELAYLYVMRYLFLFNEIVKSFKRDIKYINALNNPGKINLAFERAGHLKISLRTRYEELDLRTHKFVEELETNRDNLVKSKDVESEENNFVKNLDSKSKIDSSLKSSAYQQNIQELTSVHTEVINNDNTPGASGLNIKELLKIKSQSRQSLPKNLYELSTSQIQSFNPAYKKVTPGQTGLRNMGNTCYMNSILQALSNTNFLTNYILSDSFKNDINPSNPLGFGGDIVTEYASLVIALWNGSYSEISPINFKHMIESKNEMFRGYEQHDSQEFLLFLLDSLHEDLNCGNRNFEKISCNHENLTDSDKAQNSWKNHVSMNNSIIVHLFQGQYRSKIICDHCRISSVTFDAFMYLSLPLVLNQNRCTLEDCLKIFLAEERMTGTSQWFCSNCKVNRNSKKKIDIWKLPPYLLIHLKRFSYTDHFRQKLNTYVDFPMESFSLNEFIRHRNQQQKHARYHLYAVSNHHGNMESGHYTSFCKNSMENEWLGYDDEIVNKIRESDVKTSSAYILFYESDNITLAEFNY